MREKLHMKQIVRPLANLSAGVVPTRFWKIMMHPVKRILCQQNDNSEMKEVFYHKTKDIN